MGQEAPPVAYTTTTNTEPYCNDSDIHYSSLLLNFKKFSYDFIANVVIVSVYTSACGVKVHTWSLWERGSTSSTVISLGMSIYCRSPHLAAAGDVVTSVINTSLRDKLTKVVASATRICMESGCGW